MSEPRVNRRGLSVGFRALLQTTRGRLYAALGDVFHEEGRSYGESRDDGEIWRYIGQGLERMPYAYALAVDAADPDGIRIAVATGPQDAHRSGGASIFRLTGDRWIEDADGFPGDVSLIPELASDPDAQGQWLAPSTTACSPKGPVKAGKNSLGWPNGRGAIRRP